MTVARASEPPDTGTQVIALTWDDYLAWLGGRLDHATTAWGEQLKLGPAWSPGEHMALIGPTGEGKTTHAVGMLGLRKYVLAIDPKGEDETLSASGYTRVTSLPASGMARFRGSDQREWRRILKGIEDGHDARVIIGGGSRTDEEDEHLQQLMRDAITYSRHSGGWTLYVDEFELLSSQRMFRLGPAIERMLITARRDKTSVVTSYQAQAWVSKHATRQARRAVMWPTGDRDMIDGVAEAMGRDKHAIREAIDQLPAFHTLTIPRGKRGGPLVITSAPEVKIPKRRDGS